MLACVDFKKSTFSTILECLESLGHFGSVWVIWVLCGPLRACLRETAELPASGPGRLEPACSSRQELSRSQAVGPQGSVPLGKRRTDISTTWGICRITPTGPDYMSAPEARNCSKPCQLLLRQPDKWVTDEKGNSVLRRPFLHGS